jgi:hypothetical protein
LRISSHRPSRICNTHSVPPLMEITHIITVKKRSKPLHLSDYENLLTYTIFKILLK